MIERRSPDAATGARYPRDSTDVFGLVTHEKVFRVVIG